MSLKRMVTAGVIGVALMGFLFGTALILIPADFLLKAIFIIVGVMTVLGSIPGVLLGYAASSSSFGRLELLSSLVSMLLGVVMIFWHSEVVVLVVGVYLVVLPLINLLVALVRGGRWVAELPKMILGAILILIGPVETFAIMLDVAGWIVIGVTALFVLAAIVFACRRGARVKRGSRETGGRVFIDADGDGTIDRVYVDTTGDGNPDTATRYRDGK